MSLWKIEIIITTISANKQMKIINYKIKIKFKSKLKQYKNSNKNN